MTIKWKIEGQIHSLQGTTSKKKKINNVQNGKCKIESFSITANDVSPLPNGIVVDLKNKVWDRTKNHFFFAIKCLKHMKQIKLGYYSLLTPFCFYKDYVEI